MIPEELPPDEVFRVTAIESPLGDHWGSGPYGSSGATSLRPVPSGFMMQVTASKKGPQANTSNSPLGEYEGIPPCKIRSVMNLTLQPITGPVCSVGDGVNVVSPMVGVGGCGLAARVGGSVCADVEVGSGEGA